MNLLYLIILSLGHAVADLNQGAIPALLPFLRDAYGLSYAMSGTIVMVANLSSSVIQPIFGIVSDRKTWKWLLPLGVLTAGVGTGILSVSAGYGLILGAVALMGLGVACYHPEGSRVAYSLASERRGTAMSLFSVGGNLGMAVGPPLAGFALRLWGLRGVAAFTFISGCMAGVLAAYAPRMYRAEAGRAKMEYPDVKPEAGQCWRGELLLLAVIALRSLVQFGVLTYVPFHYVDNLGGDPTHVGKLLLAFLGAGVVGTLFSGPLGDLLGRKQVLVASTGLLFPVHLLLMSCEGWGVFVALAAEGLLIVSTFTVTLVMAQEYLPRNVALAGGLNIGLSMGIGGMASALLGVMADEFGLAFTLRFLGVLPLGAFLVSFFLPPTNKPFNIAPPFLRRLFLISKMTAGRPQ